MRPTAVEVVVGFRGAEQPLRRVEVLERTRDVHDRVVQAQRTADPAVHRTGGLVIAGGEVLGQRPLEKLQPSTVVPPGVEPQHPCRDGRPGVGRWWTRLSQERDGRLGMAERVVPGGDGRCLRRREEAEPGPLLGVCRTARALQVLGDRGRVAAHRPPPRLMASAAVR